MVTSGVKNVFFRLESVPAHLRWTARSAHRRSETEPAWNGQHGKHQSPVSGVMKMSLRGIFIHIYIYCYFDLMWSYPISLLLRLVFCGKCELYQGTNKQVSDPPFEPGSRVPRVPPLMAPASPSHQVSPWAQEKSGNDLAAGCWQCPNKLIQERPTSKKTWFFLGLWAVSFQICFSNSHIQWVYGKYRKFKAPWGRR